MNRRATAAAVTLLLAAAVACLADDALEIAVPFIADREGWSAVAYCDEAGNATIGYGRLLERTCDRLGTYWPETEPESREWLTERVAHVLADIRHHVRMPLQAHEEAALASWTYNVGVHAMEDSKLILMINSGQPRGVIIGELCTWDKETRGGRKVRSNGLSERRALEAALYMTGTWKVE